MISQVLRRKFRKYGHQAFPTRSLSSPRLRKPTQPIGITFLRPKTSLIQRLLRKQIFSITSNLIFSQSTLHVSRTAEAKTSIAWIST